MSQVLSDGEFTYLYGLTRFAQQSAASTDYFPSHTLRASLPDALGSVRQLYNQGSGIGLTQTFDPFGNLLSQEGSLSSHYGFAGEWADVTGLQHLRARYYSPIQGRFISQDPFSGIPGKPSTLNPFTYAYNNPILYTDPTGLWPDWFDYMMGAASQYADDVSFGVFSRIVGDLDYNRCYAYQSGRALGRNITIVYASVEQVFGAFLLGASLASIGPTSGFSLAAALPSGGSSIAIGGVAIGVEALGVVTGLGIAWHGTLMMAKINNDPLSSGGSSPNQMNRQIISGKAPPGIQRVDVPKVPREKLHVHFDNGAALNIDGTWKHGFTELTREQKEWLLANGWTLP